MYIYMNKSGLDSLQRITTLKKRNYYGMRLNGKYGGGFYAPNDTKALEIFNNILRRSETNENM